MYLKKFVFIFFIFLILTFNLTTSQNYIYTDQECLDCHGKPDFSQITSNGKMRSIFVDPGEWSQDIHHKSKMVCVDCHTNANPYLHFREGFFDVDCSRCHPEEAEEYQKNIHFEYKPISIDKELPLCYDCHTKHYILRHDDPSSSIHEKNVGETCGRCHTEVMVEGVLKGASLGKISGHRKGDLAERFDMMVCINCHYDDAAHGAKRVYKDFCYRCHDVRSKAGFMMGPTHIDSERWVWFNYISGGLVIFFLLGTSIFAGYKSRKGILRRIKTWHDRMKIKEEKEKKKKKAEQKQGEEETKL